MTGGSDVIWFGVRVGFVAAILPMSRKVNTQSVRMIYQIISRQSTFLTNPLLSGKAKKNEWIPRYFSYPEALGVQGLDGILYFKVAIYGNKGDLHDAFSTHPGAINNYFEE